MNTVEKNDIQTLTLTQKLAAARQALQKNAKRGMSLVEVLIVLTIMASIAGVVGVYAVGALEESNVKEAKIEVGNLDKMVQQYMLMQSPPRAPDSLEALTRGRAPVTTKVPQDHWGNDYIYRRMSDRDWEIFSCGPDGEPDTEDDISPER